MFQTGEDDCALYTLYQATLDQQNRGHCQLTGVSQPKQNSESISGLILKRKLIQPYSISLACQVESSHEKILTAFDIIGHLSLQWLGKEDKINRG